MMSMSAEATAVVAPPAPPAPEPQHPSVIREDLRRLGHFLKEKAEEILAFVEKAAPIAEGVAHAAELVPGAGPVAAVADKLFRTVGAVVMCIKHNVVGCPTCTEKAAAQGQSPQVA